MWSLSPCLSAVCHHFILAQRIKFMREETFNLKRNVHFAQLFTPKKWWCRCYNKVSLIVLRRLLFVSLEKVVVASIVVFGFWFCGESQMLKWWKKYRCVPVSHTQLTVQHESNLVNCYDYDVLSLTHTHTPLTHHSTANGCCEWSTQRAIVCNKMKTFDD